MDFRCILLLIVLISIQKSYLQKCSEVKLNERIDCAPDHPNDSQVCAQRKCCFSTEKHNVTHGSKWIPNCFMPIDYIGYKVKQIKKDFSHIVLSLERQMPSGFRKDIQLVSIVITFLNDKSLRIRITDENNARFEPQLPPLSLPEFPIAFNPLYEVEVDQNGLLSIKRKSNNRIILRTELSKLIFSDQFIQMKSSLPSAQLYGLGEHKGPFLKKAVWQLYTLFNRDIPFRQPATMNLYGSHAFYLNVEDSEGVSNGVYLLNSNAMDILLQPEPALTYRPIGGILDLFVFLGPKPEEVVREYIQLIGKPSMPPFWSLGYHQCRCCPAPHTLEQQKVITNRTIASEIPFDVQWNAKEYMIRFNDFTVDNTAFGGFGDFVKHLHQIGMHYVPIIDPGIDPTQTKGTYPPYDDGIALDIFVKNASDQILIGKVWNLNGKTVYPDFSHPSATLYWTKQFQNFHKLVAIDGSWNDMNEVSDFVTGSLDGCPKDDPLENPPYLPGNRSLQAKTLCMSAKHYAGYHYNVHSLYGYYMAIATNLALREVRQKRPFVISRATFPGQGKWSGHWDGDTESTYDEMLWTIASIMNFNMFGIPLVGGDICGFGGNAKNDSNFQELCSRWLEIGAFYPFSRNHNQKAVDQDPTALGPGVVTAAKNALQLRYSLLPYLYTLFYFAESKADTVVRPVFFEFPNDANSYGSVAESQFMWGKAFMIIPVVEPNKTKVNAYFPSGVWYEYNLELSSKPFESKGQFVELDAPVTKINTAIRGGHILAMLPPKQTTTEMRKEKFTLIVALDNQNSGSGHLYWDDGDSIDPILTQRYSLIYFETKNATLTTDPIHHQYDGSVIADNIVMLGLKTKPDSVSINGKSVGFKYDSEIMKLSLTGIELNLINSMNTIVWK